MLKTVVNFRWDEGKLSIDSHLCKEWDSLLVSAAGAMYHINHEAVQPLYEASPLFAGMEELCRAQRGMVTRSVMDSAIKGPFIIDHEAPLTDKELIAWYRANKRKGRK
jgi:hypothetical protein